MNFYMVHGFDDSANDFPAFYVQAHSQWEAETKATRLIELLQSSENCMVAVVESQDVASVPF